MAETLKFFKKCTKSESDFPASSAAFAKLISLETNSPIARFSLSLSSIFSL